MAKFEFVSKYADSGLPLPQRQTSMSAGYDFVVAEDTLVPSYLDQGLLLLKSSRSRHTPLDLEALAQLTKATGARPTLVPTGVKCQLDPGTYLELSVRSSTPLKYWLVLANGSGKIDADYYNNQGTEGHIFFQMINLSPFPIQLKKGDRLGQGIITPYHVVEDDIITGVRLGGFGSTD